MIVQEYLLIRLNEELAEMQHAISKCLRFGPKHVCKVYNIPNIDKVRKEYADMLAVAAVLEFFNIDFRADEKTCEEAIDKVIKDLENAKQKNRIQEVKN
jgi:hypothetical protein